MSELRLKWESHQHLYSSKYVSYNSYLHVGTHTQVSTCMHASMHTPGVHTQAFKHQAMPSTHMQVSMCMLTPTTRTVSLSGLCTYGICCYCSLLLYLHPQIHTLVQWNLSNMDTLRTTWNVLDKVVSSLISCFAHFSMLLGQQAVSWLERCP